MKLLLCLLACLGLSRAAVPAEAPMEVTLVKSITGETDDEVAKEVAEAALGIRQPASGSKADTLIQGMSDERIREIEESVQALEIAKTVMDDSLTEEQKKEEVMELNNFETVTNSKAQLVDSMLQGMQGQGMTQAQAEIISEANQELMGVNADSVPMEETEELEKIVKEVEVEDPTITAEEKEALEKEMGMDADSVPDESAAITEEEKMAMQEVLKSDIPSEEKEEAIVKITDGQPIDEQTQEDMATELAKEGKLDVENANTLTKVGDEDEVEKKEAEIVKDEEKAIAEDMVEKTGDMAAGEEMLTDEGPAEKQEAEKEIAQETGVPVTGLEADKTAELTPKEEKAVVAVMATENLSPKEKELAAVKIIDNQPLTQAQAQEIANDVARTGSLNQEQAQTLAKLTDPAVVRKDAELNEMARQKAANDEAIKAPLPAPLPASVPAAHGSEDEAVADNSIQHLIGQCMLRFLRHHNKNRLNQMLRKPEFIAFFTKIADANQDNQISSQEWRRLFTEKLIPYWQKAVKEEMPIPIEEWMTVDLNKDGFIDIKDELYPVLLDMQLEPIYRVINSAFFRVFDRNENGMLDKIPAPGMRMSEYAMWEEDRIWKQINAFPMAETAEVQTDLDKVVQEQGVEEGEKVVKTLEKEGLIDNQGA